MAFGARGKGKGKGKGPRRDNKQNALFKRKKFCRFTVEKVVQIDYKDVDTLRDFSSFIIGEGPVTASSILTVRWRSTASL